MAAGLDIAQSPLRMDGLFRHSGKITSTEKVEAWRHGTARIRFVPVHASASSSSVLYACPAQGMHVRAYGATTVTRQNLRLHEREAIENRCIGGYHHWLNCMRCGFEDEQRRIRHQRAINAETRSRRQESALAEQNSDKDRFRPP